MSSIRDDDLILYFYRDGLSPRRLREIEQALSASPALDARYQTLKRVLAAADQDVPPRPAVQFENRVWQRLQPRLNETDAEPFRLRRTRPLAHSHSGHARRRARIWAAGVAVMAVLAVAIYLPMTADDVPQSSPPVAVQMQAPASQASSPPSKQTASPADRALAGYVSAHLRSAEAVLLSVLNSDGGPLLPMGNGVVQSLVGDNQLYAAAAAQRGDRALAGFLESLDPILIELANQTADGEVQQVRGMRDFVQNSDLLFKLRAVEALLHSRIDRHA